ncbi:MAG: S9 family peptidase [Rhodanobacteraceae bacterium]
MRIAGCLVFAVLVVCTGSLSAHAAPGKASFQLSHLRKLVSLSDPQISPDGKRIAVIVSAPDWKSDKSKQEIDLVDVATGSRRAATWHRSGIASLHWSHDGARLGFIAKDALPDPTPAIGSDSKDDDNGIGSDDKHQQQIFVMPMDGGDPIRVTHAKRGVDAFSWSPDDTRIAFISEDEPANAKAIKHHDDAFKVTDNHFLTRKALTPWHLWIVASAGGKSTRLTKGDFSLETDQQDSAPDPAWSRDGHSIAFVRFPNPYWGPSFQSVVEVVDIAGGEPRALVTTHGAIDFDFAPDSDTFAYLRPRGGDENNGNAVYVGNAGKTRDATAALARNFNSYAWLPHGNALVLAGAQGTHAALWEQPLTGAARSLDLGDVEASAQVSVSHNGAIAFVGSTATHPAELYVMDSVDAKPRRLTNVNAFVDDLALGRTQSLDWNGPDGFHEDGALTLPVGYTEGRKYPLVLVIHGGPESSSGVGFSPLPQLLAGVGFVVFQPNYRGSTNLGDTYQHAIYRDTGKGPGEDVMAGLAAVEKLGNVDTDRIGVTGWSYGGYMTTWLTGHYKVWKAAVSGAALTDWVMDYTVAYYQTGDTYFFGGSPWSAKYARIWREQSPIESAAKVTAPTLIMGDVGDPNVPLINSYEWFHALRDNGVTVEFYAYPVDTHFPHDIVRSTDVYRRWVAWMERYLK